MTEDELRASQILFMEQFQKRLLEEGIVSDPNWLDNYLRPEFKKAMVHLARMSQESFLKKSSVFVLLGLDFMLDSNLNLWFIEANTRPALELPGATQETELKIKLLKDHLVIVTGLLRSRMKRMINYVNLLISEGAAKRTSDNELWIDNSKLRSAELHEVLKNHFEPEFEPPVDNGFKIIIDENKRGEEKYFGLNEECY